MTKEIADTSELLTRADELIALVTSDAAKGQNPSIVGAAWIFASQVKSRLQAEAPEDAEVAKFLAFWTRENARAVSASFEVAVDLLHRLQSRTSQAEVQAPAATLTDDPELDGTDFAHPAWWRGNDRGVHAVCEMLTKILDGEPLHGKCREPLQGIRERVAALLPTTTAPAPSTQENPSP